MLIRLKRKILMFLMPALKYRLAHLMCPGRTLMGPARSQIASVIYKAQPIAGDH